jgi:MoxR-like ATPase
MSFRANPNRDAWSTIAGFVYQVDITILRWLNLEESEVLELERGEDVDTVQQAISGGQVIEERVLEQVKRRQRALTLRTPAALEALVNFCEHRRLNVDSQLRFRFVTTAVAGVEAGWKRSYSGITTWEAIRLGEFDESETSTALGEIRTVLKTAAKPKRIEESNWADFNSVISSDDGLADLIANFEWSIASDDYVATEEAITDGLIQSGFASNREFAGQLLDRLFIAVIKRLSSPGLKRLTAIDLREQIALGKPAAVDQGLLSVIRGSLNQLEQRVVEIEKNFRGAAATIETLTTAVTALSEERSLDSSRSDDEGMPLDTPDLVTPAIPRTAAVQELISSLDVSSSVTVIGEPGAGKTQLCLLAAQKIGVAVRWVEIPRNYTVQQALNTLDALIQVVTKSRRPEVLKPWYEEAARALANSLVVIDNVPRLIHGDPLCRRIELLASLLKKHKGKLIVISYYPLPRASVEEAPISEMSAPRLGDDETTALLVAYGAPPKVADQITTLVSAATQGLPILVAAASRHFAGNNWQLNFQQFEAVLRADFAKSARTDARTLIKLTVPDDDSRELLYRLTLTIGAFSREAVSRVAAVPRKLNLPGEKLDTLIGLWIQPFVGDRFTLSPLLDPALANNLPDTTRKGVHAVLALATLSRRSLELLEVVTCVHHFASAGLVNQAALILIQALNELLNADPSRTDFDISTIWSSTIPNDVDINLRLYLRALQAVAVHNRGRDPMPFIDDVRRMSGHAPSDSWGAAMASGLIAIHFFRDYPTLANEQLLVAVRTYNSVSGVNYSFPSTTIRSPDGYN